MTKNIPRTKKASKAFIAVAISSSLLAYGAVSNENFPYNAQETSFNAQVHSIQQEQFLLSQQEEALRNQGATSLQIEAWKRENAVQLENLQAKEQALSKGISSAPVPMMRDPIIPSNASAEMREFLENRVKLGNALAQIHNQKFDSGSPPGFTSQDLAQFQKQNTALIQRQGELAKILAQQNQRANKAKSTLPISTKASLQMKAFILARDRLMQSQAKIRNENADANSVDRQNALQQWSRENDTNIRQLRVLGKNLPENAKQISSGQ